MALTPREFFADKNIRKQAIADLAELVAIPSVAGDREGIYPYGKQCAAALDKAAAIAEKYGFVVENHDYHCLSIIHGDKEKEVGIVVHLDVVPAGDGWLYDPFTLTVQDNLLIGRGANDDKGPFIQSLYTLRYFKENNIELPFTVRIICGSDEEVGSTDLEHYLTVRKPPVFSFTPDAEFPVCIGEKSILSLDVVLGDLPPAIKDIKGGTVSNAVPGKATAIVETDKELVGSDSIAVTKTEQGLCIEATGKTSHAAMPEGGVSAINLLVSYLIDNGLTDGYEYFTLLKNATGEYLGKTLGIAAENKDFGYVTCVGGVLSVKDGKPVQNFNIRHLPETDYSDVVSAVEKAVSPFGASVNMLMESKGYYVSADDKKIQSLTKACSDVMGIDCTPFTIGGGTYARWMPNTVAFGTLMDSERAYLGGDRGGAHQCDEYISMTEFFSGMEIYSLGLGNLSEIL